MSGLLKPARVAQELVVSERHLRRMAKASPLPGQVTTKGGQLRFHSCPALFKYCNQRVAERAASALRTKHKVRRKKILAEHEAGLRIATPKGVFAPIWHADFRAMKFLGLPIDPVWARQCLLDWRALYEFLDNVRAAAMTTRQRPPRRVS